MPAIDGGPQDSPEYSPHLYDEDGVKVGNPMAALGQAIWGGRIPPQPVSPSNPPSNPTKELP